MSTDTEAILAGVRTWAENNDVPVDSIEDEEIVEHGHSGLLIADHNPHHWATAIETLLIDTDLRAELAGHAVDRAERFDWGRTIAAVLEALPETSGAASRPSEPLGAC